MSVSVWLITGDRQGLTYGTSKSASEIMRRVIELGRNELTSWYPGWIVYLIMIGSAEAGQIIKLSQMTVPRQFHFRFDFHRNVAR